MNENRRLLQAITVSGLLYAVGAFVPQIDGPPVESATAAQIRRFLAENDTALRILATIGALSIPLVLVFTVALARLIRDQLPGSALADLVVGGGVLVAIWHWLVIAGTSSTLVQSLDGTALTSVDDATLRGWYGFSNVIHTFADIGMCAMVVVMAATSLAALRSGLFARWLAMLGLVFAAGGLIGTIGITVAWQPLSFAWFVGIFGWWLWALAVAVTCGLRLRRAAAHRVPATAR